MKIQTTETKNICHILSSEEISFLLHSKDTGYSEEKDSLLQKSLELFVRPQIQPLFSQTLKIKTKKTQPFLHQHYISVFEQQYHQHTVKILMSTNTQATLLSLCLGFCSPQLLKKTALTGSEKCIFATFRNKFNCGIRQMFNSFSAQDIKDLPTNSMVLLQIGTTEIQVRLYIDPNSKYIPQKKSIATIRLPSHKTKLQNILTWQKGTFIPLSDLNDNIVAEVVTDKKTIAQAAVQIKNFQITINSVKEVD